MRDRIGVRIINALAVVFLSKEYRAKLKEVIDLGLGLAAAIKSLEQPTSYRERRLGGLIDESFHSDSGAPLGPF